MTTITTTQHSNTPLWAAVAAGAALVLGGALGVAVGQSSDQPTPADTHATTAHAGMWGFDKYDYYHGPNAPFYHPNTNSNTQQSTQQSDKSFGRQMGL